MEYNEEFRELTDKVLELLAAKNFREIKALLDDLKPQDSALLLDEIPEKDMLVIFRLLGKENAAETFVEMSYDSQELLLNAFSDAELKAVFDEMFLDDTVDIIEEMPANVVSRIVKQTDTETRTRINEILHYPKDSAGTIMTVEYVSLRGNWTVKQCFDHIRKVAVDMETISTCYVIDDKRKLLGRVTVKDLLLHDYETPISEFMETDPISAETTEDKEFVSQQISKYDLNTIPVVDGENRMVGIITVDDVLDVMEQEATEDIAIMAAVTPSTDTYMEQSVLQIWKNRIPWLLLLMISATFTGLIINTFEERLNLLSPLLFACIPMLMDTGGNAGSQASVTIIRGLALDEIRPRDAAKVLWKEIRVSALLAACLAVVCFGKLYLLDGLAFGSLLGYGTYPWYICLAVSASLFATIVIAKVVGCLMPLLAKVCKLDPAVVASPFITTIVDALSLIIFCLVSILIVSPFA